MTPSIDQALHLFANLLPNWTSISILTLLPNFGVFHRTLQRVRLANRGRLLLRTLLSLLGLAFVVMLRPFFPELVMSTDLLSFEPPSVLLFCFVDKSSFWLKNENDYDQMHSLCDFMKQGDHLLCIIPIPKNYGNLKVVTVHFCCVVGIHGGCC